ncbi:MAG: site-2 protease family protein [Myxococcota bacterium]|nr:site-2 protease family protein [Myxococcota bacterium]
MEHEDRTNPSLPPRPTSDAQWGPLGPLSERAYAEPQQHARPPNRTGLRRWGSLAVLAAFLFGKVKWLLAGLKFLKMGSLVTMLLSVWAYSWIFGWPFAVGFVALIFVHEMGHAVALRQQGIPAGAPVFIPFLGAFIAMKGRPRDAYVEAIVGIGGPILGTIGAVVCLVIAILTDPYPGWWHMGSQGMNIFYGLAHVGFLINLFNMIPVSPMDGGRITGAISRSLWILGYIVGVGAFLLTGSGILALILFIGLFTLWRRFKYPEPGYYDIPTWKKVAVGVGYFGLLAFLAIGMWVAEVAGRLGVTEGTQVALTLAAGIHVFGGALIEGLTPSTKR